MNVTPFQDFTLHKKTDVSHFFIVSLCIRQEMVHKRIVYKEIRKCRRNLFVAKLEVLKWRHIHSQSPGSGLAVLYPTGSKI